MVKHYLLYPFDCLQNTRNFNFSILHLPDVGKRLIFLFHPCPSWARVIFSENSLARAAQTPFWFLRALRTLRKPFIFLFCPCAVCASLFFLENTLAQLAQGIVFAILHLRTVRKCFVFREHPCAIRASPFLIYFINFQASKHLISYKSAIFAAEIQSRQTFNTSLPM